MNKSPSTTFMNILFSRGGIIMVVKKEYISINHKIIRYSILFLILTLILIWYLTSFLTMEVKELEESLIKQDMQRVLQSIDNEIENLKSANKDYANWDDTKNYALGMNDEYIEENFMDETFENNRWNILIIFDKDRKSLFEKNYSLYENAEIEADKEIEKIIINQKLLEKITDSDKTVSGLIKTKKGEMIISINPILTSFKEGPVSGYFVTGRYVNEEFLDRIKKMTKYELNIIGEKVVKPYNISLLTLNNIKRAATWATIEADKELIKGYLQVMSIDDMEGIIIEYNKKMGFHIESKKTIYIYVGVIILIYFANMVGIIIFFSNRFIRKLKYILRKMETIISKQDLSTRVRIDTNDEISVLGNTFNQMLDTIEELNQKLAYKANIDQLTELPNRHHFLELMKEQLKEEKGALLYLDIDKFKEINDSYGHFTGDEIIRQFVISLNTIMLEDDIACRMGGDEFLLWTKYGSIEELEKRINNLLKISEVPVEVAGNKVKCMPSIGIALYPVNAKMIEELISKADSAMYKAKNNKMGYCYYDKD